MKNRVNSGKILITGAGGFIGGGLFEKLRRLNPIGVFFHLNESVPEGDFIEADLREEGRVKEIFDQYKPETVFHLAGFPSPQNNEKNPQFAYDTNRKITENIVKNLSEDAHIIFPSTDKVFDGSDPNPDEDARVNPSWLYANLKHQCEEIIKKKTDKFHIVRLPIVHSLGKPIGASRGSFIDKILIDLKAGQEVRVFKNVQRCFLRVEELFDVFEVFINDTHYGTYHVGTKVMSYYDRLCALCDELGIDWKDKVMPVEGNINPLVQNLNTDKLKNTFGIILT